MKITKLEPVLAGSRYLFVKICTDVGVYAVERRVSGLFLLFFSRYTFQIKSCIIQMIRR